MLVIEDHGKNASNIHVDPEFLFPSDGLCKAVLVQEIIGKSKLFKKEFFGLTDPIWVSLGLNFPRLVFFEIHHGEHHQFCWDYIAK